MLITEDTNTIKHLRDGFFELASFVQDKEAEIVNYYHKEIDRAFSLASLGELAKFLELKGTSFRDAVDEINEKIQEEFSLYYEEFVDFIFKHKKDSEIYDELKKAFQILDDIAE